MQRVAFLLVAGVPCGALLAPRRVPVDLGGGHSLIAVLPPVTQDVDGAVLAELAVSPGSTRAAFQQQYEHLYGSGDIIWPASIALARLIVHCPSFVRGKRVVELGCGLGAQQRPNRGWVAAAKRPG